MALFATITTDTTDQLDYIEHAPGTTVLFRAPVPPAHDDAVTALSEPSLPISRETAYRLAAGAGEITALVVLDTTEFLDALRANKLVPTLQRRAFTFPTDPARCAWRILGAVNKKHTAVEIRCPLPAEDAPDVPAVPRLIETWPVDADSTLTRYQWLNIRGEQWRWDATVSQWYNLSTQRHHTHPAHGPFMRMNR